MRAKRLYSLVPAGFVVASTLAGCNSILGLNQLSIGEQEAGVPPHPDAPAVSDAPPDNYVGECTTNAECTDRATAEAGALPDGSMPTIPAVCVRPEARCAQLLTDDCTTITGDYRDDDAILLGTLFSTVGAQSAMNLQRQQSATLAAEEINAVGGIPAPASGGKRQKLVMLSCNEADPAGTPAGTVLKRAGAHLINDLHVPAIVGPNTSQDTIELSNSVSVQAGTVLLTPTAVAAQIAELMDNDLTWLMVPSDQQRGPLMINQINQLETELKAARGKSIMKLGIVYRDDAVGLGTLRSLNGLIFNGQPLNAAINTGSGGNVSIDGYQFSASNQDPIVNKYVNFAPDIIVLAGLAEVITTVMNPIEQRWSDAGSERAYYVLTDQVKGPDLITSTTNMPNLRTRVRGTGLTPGATSVPVQTAFELSYRAKYGVTPTASGSGPSYDSTYAIAYALAGTRDLPVSGDAISKGLRKLAGGTAINVGPGSPLLTAFGKLAAGENITATGTYLPMEWDDKGAVVNGTIEIWCVGLPGTSTTPAYGSSGLTYDIKTDKTMGAYVQCPP